MLKSKWVIPGHLAFWLCCYFVLLATTANVYTIETEINGTSTTEIERNFEFIPVAFLVISMIFTFYTHQYLLMPKFLGAKKRRLYWSQALGLVILAVAIVWFLNIVLDYLTIGALYQPSRFAPLFWFLLNFVSWALAFGLGLSQNYLTSQRLNRQLQREKLEAQLKFLKSQINPHFLFNTLNNLFALSERAGNEELSEGITELSNLMRYMLYEAKEDRVYLNKEISFLQSTIGIHRLRHEDDDDLMIELSIEGEPDGLQIAPLILVPFVENAFKHGVHVSQPSIIRIQLKIVQQELHFSVQNKIFEKESIFEHEGVGLDNVKKRLALIYGKSHNLEIMQTDEHFIIRLNLPLDRT